MSKIITKCDINFIQLGISLNQNITCPSKIYVFDEKNIIADIYIV